MLCFNDVKVVWWLCSKCLPQGAKGWFAVSASDISSSYPLTFQLAACQRYVNCLKKQNLPNP